MHLARQQKARPPFNRQRSVHIVRGRGQGSQEFRTTRFSRSVAPNIDRRTGALMGRSQGEPAMAQREAPAPRDCGAGRRQDSRLHQGNVALIVAVVAVPLLLASLSLHAPSNGAARRSCVAYYAQTEQRQEDDGRGKDDSSLPRAFAVGYCWGVRYE